MHKLDREVRRSIPRDVFLLYVLFGLTWLAANVWPCGVKLGPRLCGESADPAGFHLSVFTDKNNAIP